MAQTKAELQSAFDELKAHSDREQERMRELERQLKEAQAAVEFSPPESTVPDELRALADAALRDFAAGEIGKKPQPTCNDCKRAQDSRNGGKPWDVCDRHTYIRNCPECGQNHTSGTIHLDFVGHADATNRLLEMDPGWTWEPMSYADDGSPLIVEKDGEAKMWIWLILHVYRDTPNGLEVIPVRRPGVGTVQIFQHTREVEKQLISDALRNAAMRAGVGLVLWAKGDREWNPEAAAVIANAEAGGQQDARPAPSATGLDMDRINDALNGLSGKGKATVMKAARGSTQWKEGDTDGVIELIKAMTSTERTEDSPRGESTPATEEEAVDKLKGEFGATEEDSEAKPEPEPDSPTEDEIEEEMEALRDQIRTAYGQLKKGERTTVQDHFKDKDQWPMTTMTVDQLKGALEFITSKAFLNEEPF